MGLKKINDNLYLLPGSPSTLIAKLDETIIIDPGKGKDRHKDIRREMRKLSLESKISLATHTHADHIEAVPKLNVTLYVHESEFSSAKYKMVREIITVGSKLFNSFLREADRLNNIENVKTFSWDEEIFGIKTIQLDGHSPGMTGFVINNTLYAGDSFFGENLLSKVGMPYFIDYDLFMNSLNKLLDFAEKGYTLIPSHGPIVSGESAVELIKKNIEITEKLENLILELLSTKRYEDSLLKELMKKMNTITSTFTLYLNRVPLRAILTKLVNENKVEIVEDNGILKFKSR